MPELSISTKELLEVVDNQRMVLIVILKSSEGLIDIMSQENDTFVSVNPNNWQFKINYNTYKTILNNDCILEQDN
jgi:hypothetical protein